MRPKTYVNMAYYFTKYIPRRDREREAKEMGQLEKIITKGETE